VEDSVTSCGAIEKLFTDRQIKVTRAASGMEAFDCMVKETFDCIVLDLGLGDMTGVELLKKLDHETSAALPPFIVYTAGTLSEAEHTELSRCTEGILFKSNVSPDRLLRETSLFLHSVRSKLPSERQESRPMLHQPEEVLQGRRILVVDDDMRNTFALASILEEVGMEVKIAENGQVALELLAQDEAYDLVLMDIMMPVMDGHEAMTRIRQDRQLKDLPIIALTAKTMPEDREECLLAGANDYLTKPVESERLLNLMRVWLFKS